MKWTKRRVNNLFFLLGVVTVVVMLFTFDVSFVELWEHICHAGYWLIPILGVWIFVYGINALALRTIIKGNCGEDVHINFWRLYKQTVTGYALNYATPVGGLGGEPYRIMALSKELGNQRATSSVILYAMMHFFAHFWLWFTSIFFYLGVAWAGYLPLTLPIALVMGVIALFCMVAIFFFRKGFRKGLAFSAIRFAGHIPGLKKWSARFISNHEEALHNVDAQIASLHGENRHSFYGSLLLEYAARIVQSLEIMFMLLLFGVDFGGDLQGLFITFMNSILILSFTTLLANIIGFLPMQLGVQEGGFVISIAVMGLSAALGIFVSIICRVREIFWILVGLIFMKMDTK